MNGSNQSKTQRSEEERNELLQRVVEYLELPMVIFGFIWLGLLIIELVSGLPYHLRVVSLCIWMIFVLDFLFELIIAPEKVTYLKSNWLMIPALIVPALRVFRVLQVIRVVQGAQLFRVLSSISRSMHALGSSLGRHGFRYVMALTLVVTFVGAAGMYAFERNPPSGHGMKSYAEALWWTAMIMTTLGSGYWPQTSAGRILCVILALFAFSVFGYVTAALATFLVGREAEEEEGELPSVKSISALHEEIARLTEEVRALSERLPKDEP